MYETICLLLVTRKDNLYSLLGSYCVSGLIMTGQGGKCRKKCQLTGY
jgi:hypothetical protein